MSRGRVEIRDPLGRREARRFAEPEPVKEIAQPLPTGVDGHDTASAAAAAAQQNVELEQSPTYRDGSRTRGTRERGERHREGLVGRPPRPGFGLARCPPLARRLPMGYRRRGRPNSARRGIDTLLDFIPADPL
jgi:hypothetical protein